MNKPLGNILRKHREKKGENITQTARGIGIDRSYLSKIEHGHEIPPPPLLNSILNHLGVKREVALEISKIAGYENIVHFSVRRENSRKEVKFSMAEDQVRQPANAKQVNLPNNVPVLYTDSIFVTGNKYGIVLDIAQNVGPTNQQNVVTRIGMSREHAEALVNVLAKNLTKGKLQRASTENIKN